MNQLRIIFTKIKDYFTANTGRKIFFYGLVGTILGLILTYVTRLSGLTVMTILAVVVAMVGTLWDSMQRRFEFLQKIKEIQYEHLKNIYDKQESGEEVAMTPTFTDEELRYLRHRKWGFIIMIVFKVFMVLALFSLLLTV